MSRNGAQPVHYRLRRIRNYNLQQNLRLAPGVRADDVPIPSVTPPIDGDHDFSSELREGENAHAIFDLNEFAAKPANVNGPENNHTRAWVLQQARRVRQRDRQRLLDWLNRPSPNPEERNYTTISEAEPEKILPEPWHTFNVSLPPPPPLPPNPIIYP